MSITPTCVARQYPLAGEVQRHEAALAELSAADRQHTVLQIDVVRFQCNRLADPQPRHRQESKQAVVRCASQATERREGGGGHQQALDLLVAVQIRTRAPRPEGSTLA